MSDEREKWIQEWNQKIIDAFSVPEPDEDVPDILRQFANHCFTSAAEKCKSPNGLHDGVLSRVAKEIENLKFSEERQPDGR